MPLLGKPVVDYTIEYARGVKEIDRTVVSTDSEEIAKVCRDAGAEVVMRPAEMATDDAPVEWALRHVVRQLGGGGSRSRSWCFCMETFPFGRRGSSRRP